MKRNAMFFAESGNESLILFRCRAPQLEVAMRYRYPVPSLAEKVQHDHGVHAPADRQKDTVMTESKIMLLDERLERFLHQPKIPKVSAMKRFV